MEQGHVFRTIVLMILAFVCFLAFACGQDIPDEWVQLGDSNKANLVVIFKSKMSFGEVENFQKQALRVKGDRNEYPDVPSIRGRALVRLHKHQAQVYYFWPKTPNHERHSMAIFLENHPNVIGVYEDVIAKTISKEELEQLTKDKVNRSYLNPDD